MEIILLEDVEKLGYRFDTLTVKGGYGRNYLLPNKLAIVANRANKATIAERLRQIKMKEDRLLAKIEEVVAKINAATLKIGAKVGTTDKIFGSVTNLQLAEVIKKQTGVEIDRRKIIIPEEVKVLGTYTATIDFGQESKYDIEFEVVSE
ncbi:MAG: 50S ribosomal protein L9 [Chitinophagales bacterium]